MIRRNHLVATTIVAVAVLVGCDAQRSSSPTAPPMSAAASASRIGGPQASSSSESSPRSGPLHVTKDCSEYTRLAGGFCTITSSNIPQIEVGSRVIYEIASGPTSLDSDLRLDLPGPGNNAANGHVVLSLVTATGIVTFSGGTGKFTHFNASVVVTHLTGRSWAWDGTYSFCGVGEDCDD